MSEKRGFVLLGFPRSGTTLLARLLNAHPEISCPPETYLMSAAARFLHEQHKVEGPPIGGLAGLKFCGIDAEEVYRPLRELVFGFQERIAGSKPVWVEKTAIDVFHLETLEPFLSGQVRFIILQRNPLDVIVSNLKLATVMGAQLDDLFALTQGHNTPEVGLAHAWSDRMRALREFEARMDRDAIRLSYEDLTRTPADALKRVFDFVGVDADADRVIENAFTQEPPVGLGDFNFDATNTIVAAKHDAWRGKIGQATLAHILPILAEEMQTAGYEVPRARRPPTRDEAVRQFQMAAALKRERSRSKTHEK